MQLTICQYKLPDLINLTLHRQVILDSECQINMVSTLLVKECLVSLFIDQLSRGKEKVFEDAELEAS